MNPTTEKSKKSIYRYIPIAYEHYPTIFDIDYIKLKKLGFTTILFDYDFTLAPWKQQIDDKTLGWLFRVMDLAVPNEFVDSIFDINYSKLKEKNYELLIFDFDNTLTTWRSEKIPENVLNLFERLSKDFKILIASNGKEYRFDKVKEQLNKYDIKVMGYSLKPLPFRIKKRVKELHIASTHVVLIGDQLFTDIIAGNNCGFYTIKVNPISNKERIITKILRFFEKLSIKTMREKPKF
ncbi:MAG: hypothetical protein B6I29_03925 [Marinitoga sp. 4572_148]|nr:MAG: hypothetical protein B6I29_03925 [Marinitoga sp. 4572_148]